MAAQVSSYNHTANCCSTYAAACSSARISRILDTAVILVVSIFISLINIRLWMG